MSDVIRVGEIEINQDLEYQKKDWQVGIAGRLLMLAIVAAALTGAFGHGYLARAAGRSADGKLRLEYDRIVRRAAPAALRACLLPGSGNGNRRELRLRREHVQMMQMENITPEPERFEEHGDDAVFYFAAPDPTKELCALFRFKPDGHFLYRADAAVPGSAKVSFWQFVLP